MCETLEIPVLEVKFSDTFISVYRSLTGKGETTTRGLDESVKEKREPITEKDRK